MSIRTLVKSSEYHDSVKLMLVARELTKLSGIQDAAVVMATEANKSILEQSNLLTDEAKAATPNDLVIAVNGEDKAAQEALGVAEALLAKKAESANDGISFRPRSIRGAVKSNPGANTCVISVAGRFAADETWEAIRAGLHTLLFSDNVSLEDEIALKKAAAAKGLLMMGPGAGTAIINGVALGFANKLPSGPVGVVSAAGTGLQEVTTLLAKHGVGITQGLGTGGRDLREEVGGIMMLEGLKALQADADTKVLLLVSKPPSKKVAEMMIAQAKACNKPTVVCFMGAKPEADGNVIPASTLQEAALKAAKASGLDMDVEAFIAAETETLRQQAIPLRAGLPAGRNKLRGLFSGGTLSYEAQVIWRDMLKAKVWSNAPLEKANQMADSTKSEGHAIIDLGEEEFTVGRPHPMIDQDLRCRRILQETSDPETGVLVLDVVLGYGTHPDPAGEMAASIRKAHEAGIVVIASVTGANGDPQDVDLQAEILRGAGAIVCASNAAAARLAGFIIA